MHRARGGPHAASPPLLSIRLWREGGRGEEVGGGGGVLLVCFFFFFFFLWTDPPSTAVQVRHSVPQDDLHKAGHVRLFGLVGGEEGMLLRSRGDTDRLVLIRVAVSSDGRTDSQPTPVLMRPPVSESQYYSVTLTMSSVYVGRSLETFFKLHKQKQQ